MTACGGCAAQRAAERAGIIKYLWTGLDKDGNIETVKYDKEVEAKAKVMRRGGSYVPVQGG